MTWHSGFNIKPTSHLNSSKFQAGNKLFTNSANNFALFQNETRTICNQLSEKTFDNFQHLKERIANDLDQDKYTSKFAELLSAYPFTTYRICSSLQTTLLV